MRRSSGQVALSLNLFIAIFIVGSLGLVAFEISRILLAREQLKNGLELAALAGGSAMASTSQTGAQAQTLGSTVATNILEMNSVLGIPLTNSVSQESSVASLRPQSGHVAIYYEFDDPITKQPSPTGNVMKIYGAYAYPLFSGGFGAIGVAVYTIVAQATAGLPALDLEIVYSNDTGIDDQTPVTFVRRYWDPNVPGIAYHIPDPGSPEQGPLTGIVCSPPIGSYVNGLPPQNLDIAGNPTWTNCTKEFSELGSTGKTVPLRGITNTGDPPGDAPVADGGDGLQNMTVGPGPASRNPVVAYCQPDNPRGQRFNRRQFDTQNYLRRMATGLDQFLEQPAEAWFTAGPNYGTQNYNPWGAQPTMFTDVVVNLDGNNQFGGYTAASPSPFAQYPFPTLDYVVEASRGNMENFNFAPNTHTDGNIGSASTPGYLNAYQCLAYAQLQPKNTIETALQGFITKIQQTSDAHFGLVVFNDRAGTAPNDSLSAPAVSSVYPAAGNCTYAVPEIHLNPTANNAAQIQTQLSPPTTNVMMMTPNGGSNLASGLNQALQDLQDNARPGAMQAIVVVTDTVPNVDLAGNLYSSPTNNAPALANAITAANTAHSRGIPIFVVGLDQSGQMTPYFQSQFSDTQPGGLVYTAGNGGVLYALPWTNQAQASQNLVGTFNNVVRQLMSLVSTQLNAMGP